MFDQELRIILLPVLGFFLIARVIEWRISKNLPPIKKALNSLTLGLIMTGVWMFVLMLCLPSPYYLESYGYPELKSIEEVRGYLQEHNRLLRRIIDIVRWLLLFLALGLVPLLYRFAKTIATSMRSVESSKTKIFDFDSKSDA